MGPLKRWGLVAAIAGSASLLAQTPLLRVQTLPNPRGVGLDLVVTNVNTVPATAWYASADYEVVKTNPKDPTTTATVIYWSNPPALVAQDQSLAPQIPRRKNIGREAAKVTATRCVAVIYADGSSAGEPKLVQALIAQRKAALREIARLEPVLRDAANSSDLDLNDLSETLRERAERFDAELKVDAPDMPEEPNPVNCVCQTLATQLHLWATSHARTAWPQGLAAAQQDLETVRENLLSSLPPLTP